MLTLIEENFPAFVSPIHSIPLLLFLVYVPHLIKGGFIVAGRGVYDNVTPREQVHKVKGACGEIAKRAVFTHENSWEAFSYYTAAVLMALIAKVPVNLLSPLCSFFLVCRALYIPFYMFGTSRVLAFGRSLVFAGGMLAVARIMTLAGQYYQSQ